MTRKDLLGTKRMLRNDLIFIFQEVALVLLIPEISGRSSGTGRSWVCLDESWNMVNILGRQGSCGILSDG